MNNKKIILGTLTVICMPMITFANTTDYGAYNETTQPETTYTEYQQPSYNAQSYPQISTYQTYNNNSNVNFFIGLNTSLVSYDKITIKYDDVSVSDKQATTSVNYDIFDKTGLVLGVDTDNDFRLSLGIQHYNTETKLVSGTETETSVLGLGLMLDIPFVKKEITIPFLTLGIKYISVEQSDIDITFPAYQVGLGLTHNFTQDIFGTLRATYSFMSKTDITDIDASYKEDLFNLSVGLGYKF